KARAPRFSPMFDTAHALFWNVPERRIRQMIDDQNQFETYVKKCTPPVGWDGKQTVDFSRLIGLIWNSFDGYRKNIEVILARHPLERCFEMIDREFSHLMSAERREIIKRCLNLRQIRLDEAVREFKGLGEPK